MEGGSDGNGGSKGSRDNDSNTSVGSGGAGYMTDGESVCGTYKSGATQDCDETNVIAQGGRAYLNGNMGGFESIAEEDQDRSGASGGYGGFGGGGQGK